MIFEFSDVLWYWRGPSPFYFVTMPEPACEQIAELAPSVSYGWGMIPVAVDHAAYHWTTALWPKDGRYIVPIKAMVRRGAGLVEGEPVELRVSVEV